MIYVISDGVACKIGYTSGDPAERLKNLQTGNPNSLSLITSFPGDRCEEMRLHRKFADKRLSGEWFALSPVDLAQLRPFSEWLLLHVGQDDIVGDLADDWARDPLPEPKCYKDLRSSLDRRSGGNEAIIAAGHAAWREFMRGTPTKLVSEQRKLAAQIRSGIGLGPGCYWLKDGMHRVQK